MSLALHNTFEERGVKRKRDMKRRRASLACETCRKQKEKCEGGPPCWRCDRLGRPCRFQQQSTSKKTMSPTPARCEEPYVDTSSQRVESLETIARYFLGDVPMDNDNLSRIAAKCTRSNSEEGSWDVNESFDVQFVSRDVAFYSGEFSHWNFSEKLRRSMSDRRDAIEPTVKEYWRPTHLQSSIRIIDEVIGELPPRPIAEFLINVFFKYAEVNNFYMEQGWITEKLHICYSSQSEYRTADIPWVCCFFVALAIGTQMAHMEEDKSASDLNALDEAYLCSEDTVSLSFYRVACRLIPDVILAASQESAQAFLLLAAFALPVSTGGLSYTYFGLALKMAIQNGMHRRCSESAVECDNRTIEFRNRLFWTIYTLERRTSIMHGRPVSIARSEISADLPKRHHTFESPNYSNMMAFINVVFWTSEVAETLTLFKRCPKRLFPDYAGRLMQLRTSIKQWWNSLPANIECRDLNPQGPLFRQNCQLKMCYMLIYIYMGRPFIFESNERRLGTGHLTELVEDCVQSAVEILDTLQLLSDHTGLCRASYNEFSSCRAALLVILAESLNVGRYSKLKDELSRGMVLIRQMIGGTSSESEISYIESIEAAIRNLSSKQEESVAADVEIEQTPSSAYARFKDWTQYMKKDKAPANHLELSSFSPTINFSPGADDSVLRSDFNDFTDLFNPNWSAGDDLGLGLDPEAL